MAKLYLIGSLRNPEVPLLANRIRDIGFDVFDDWFAAGEAADTAWREYELTRGHSYAEALRGYAARHVFDFDYHHLNESDAAVLLLPAGKSGHLELGYIRGQGKPGYVLFDAVPERWDVLYQLATDVFFEQEALFGALTALLASTNVRDGQASEDQAGGCAIRAVWGATIRRPPRQGPPDMPPSE
jgi:hypothetical protein